MKLSDPQRRLAQMILDGMSFKQMCRELRLTNVRLGTLIGFLRKETDCKDRYDLFIHADRLGLVRPSDAVLSLGTALFPGLHTTRSALAACKAVANCNTEAELDRLLAATDAKLLTEEVTDCAAVMRKLLKNQKDGGLTDAAAKLRGLLEAQGAPGNWNYDSYMLGLYNGMELALATLENRDAKYRVKPEEGWIHDRLPKDFTPLECDAVETTDPQKS